MVAVARQRVNAAPSAGLCVPDLVPPRLRHAASNEYRGLPWLPRLARVKLKAEGLGVCGTTTGCSCRR